MKLFLVFLLVCIVAVQSIPTRSLGEHHLTHANVFNRFGALFNVDVSYFSGARHIGFLGGGLGGSTGLSQSSSFSSSQSQSFNQNVGGFNGGLLHQPILPSIGLNGPMLHSPYPYIQG